jgi:hypothetical protein
VIQRSVFAVDPREVVDDEAAFAERTITTLALACPAITAVDDYDNGVSAVPYGRDVGRFRDCDWHADRIDIAVGLVSFSGIVGELDPGAVALEDRRVWLKGAREGELLPKAGYRRKSAIEITRARQAMHFLDRMHT